jgi:TIR domain
MPSEAQGYDAFISYSHHDEVAARRIQHFLERYRLPPGILPARNRLRVFRDATDIRTGSLSDELNQALDASRALIVCCSSDAVKSRWVSQEIERFLERDPKRPIAPCFCRVRRVRRFRTAYDPWITDSPICGQGGWLIG